jgi:hypothetical protein
MPGRRHSEPTNQRAFQTTLKSLQALQKERKLAEQTEAASKTQPTDKFVSQTVETHPDEIPIGLPEGYFDGHALQALYYAEMNALEEQERKQANERYLSCRESIRMLGFGSFGSRAREGSNTLGSSSSTL